MIRLRVHHINCFYYYRGMGYNHAFITRMNFITNYLKNNPETKIKFVTNCDYICEKCKNRKGKVCYRENHILELDNNTAKFYNIDINKIYTYGEIEENIYKNFDKSIIKKICQDCQWFKLSVCG